MNDIQVMQSVAKAHILSAYTIPINKMQNQESTWVELLIAMVIALLLKKELTT